MKKILLFAFALISIFKVNAQSQCAADEYDAFLKRTNPTYATERLKMEQQIYSILKNKQNNPNGRIQQNSCELPTSVITLPVVVHIIHKGEAIGTGTNISDAQILDAIRGLNESYRRVIGDGVDMEIQFALAVRDTNNNITNGINRVNGSSVSKYVQKGVVFNDQSGVGASIDTIRSISQWDPTKYINIIIFDLRGVCGYASYYSSYVYIGFNCLNSLTHEIGHAFGLLHTFAGDGSGNGTNPSTQCPPNNDCLFEGDLVCDTPPHKKNECSTTNCTTIGDLQNSYKNYMSYCSNRTRFTQGQKDRVRSYLTNYYVPQLLISSPALIPTNTVLDAGINSIYLQDEEGNLTNNVLGGLCNGMVKPRFVIYNYGSQIITNIEGTVVIDGISQNFISNRTILSNDSIWITLPQMQLQNMIFDNNTIHNYNVNISKINGLNNDYSIWDNHFCINVTASNYTSKIIPKVLPANAGTLSVDTIYVNCQKTYSVTIRPKSNYKFIGWYYSGVDLGNDFYFGDIPLTFDTILNTYVGNGNRCLSLYPTAVLYKLDTLIINSNIPQGVIKGYATFSYGTVTDTLCINDTIINDTTFITKGNNIILHTYSNIQAISTGCATFSHWLKNGEYFTPNPNLTISSFNNNDIYIAIFIRQSFNISITPNPSNGGIVIGAGNFACDSSITVKAKVKTGYKFTNWTDGSTIVSTDSNYTFLVSGARNLKANFSIITGIKQTTINEISKIYPNPADDILQVEIRSKQNTSLTLNIIDMKGSLLETKTLTNSKGTFNTSFDVSKLSKGNYILNLYDEEGMASYKFIVQ